jgi:hypothetical protein
MTIIAQLPDGTQLEFPDNTPPEVMQAKVKEYLAKQSHPISAQGSSQSNATENAQSKEQLTKPTINQQQNQKTKEQQILESVPRFGLSDIPIGIAEVVGQMANNLIGLGVGGAQVLAEAPFFGADEAIKDGQETIKAISDVSSPKTKEGKLIGEQVAGVLHKLNMIPAGWGGIAELLAGNSINDAVNTVKDISERGLIDVAADKTFEKTGSPVLATIVKASPEIASLILPVKMVKADLHKKALKEAENKLQVVEALTQNKPITDLSFNDQVSKYKLANRDKWQQPTKAEVELLSHKLETDPEFAQAFAEKLPQIEKVKSFDDVVKQQWDIAALNDVAVGSKQDIRVMRKMLDAYEEGLKSNFSKIGNRPIMMAGKALNDRVKFLLDKKQQAGKKVGEAARNLRGVKVPFENAVDKFINGLADEGVVFNGGKPITKPSDYMKLDFRNSSFNGSKASEDLIRNYMRRLTNQVDNIDGFNLHAIKQQLPTQIEIAKNKRDQGGLVKKAELMLNDLRRDINESLRKVSPEYKAANDEFATAIKPLEAFNEVMPKNARINWEGVNADNAGLQLRKVLSNYNNAGDMVKALKNLDETVKIFGGKFDNDPIKQAIFAINLDKRLGANATTSLQGVSESATAAAIKDIPTNSFDAVKTLGNVIRKAKRTDETQAIKAMRQYLNEIERTK